MNKGFCFLLLLLLILGSCNSNTTDKTASATNDSIQKYLALAGNDTLAFDKRIKYNDKAVSFMDLEKNDSLTREYLNLVVYNYVLTNSLSNYKKYSDEFYKKIAVKKDTLGLARHYRYKGIYFRNIKLYDSSFYFYLKSEKLFKTTKDSAGLAKVYFNKSACQLSLDDYLGSELSSKKAYYYFSKNKYYYETFNCLTIISTSYHNMKQYEKAISTLKEALRIVMENNIANRQNNYLISTCLNNIGNAYREQERYSEAIYYFKLALKEKNISKEDPELYGHLLNNLGFCYLKTNDYQKLPELFESAKKIFDLLEIKNESAVCDIYLSEFFIRKKDTLKAHSHAERALQLAKNAKAPYYYLTALSNAGSINPKKAPRYIKDYHRINDSLLFIERNARNQYYKIQLETDEITQQKDTALKQRSIVVIVAFTFFIITLLIFIIARQRLKQKELRLKQTEQKANEEIYQLMLTQESKEEKARQIEKKRIGLELHDGIMNKLVSTRLNLSILSISRDEATVKKCLDYIKDIQNIEKEIRNVAHDLNQEVSFDSNSFSKLFADFIKQLNRTSNTRFKMEVDTAIDWNTISNSSKMNLYRIIQEASHNIIKHAKAKNAVINILINGKNLNLSIADDGVGINPSNSENGIGLKNMKYRIKLLKGKFKINSKPNSGTSINITIPLKEIN